MNSKGIMTIEALFGSLLIIIVLLAAANAVTVSFARNYVSQQVEIMAVNASLNGGLLQSHYDEFVQDLDARGYDTAKISVEVQRVTSGSLEGSYILTDSTSAYVSISDTNNQLHLSVTVPYKSGQLFYIIYRSLGDMSFERRFISRRE